MEGERVLHKRGGKMGTSRNGDQVNKGGGHDFLEGARKGENGERNEKRQRLFRTLRAFAERKHSEGGNTPQVKKQSPHGPRVQVLN